MIFFVLVLHAIALLLLMRTIWWMSKQHQILPTIHNLLILGLWAFGLLFAIYLSVSHPWIYLGVGAVLGLFQFVIDSIELPGRPNYSVSTKIALAIPVVLAWPEWISFTIFCIWHADKINLDEEF